MSKETRGDSHTLRVVMKSRPVTVEADMDISHKIDRAYYTAGPFLDIYPKDSSAGTF